LIVKVAQVRLTLAEREVIALWNGGYRAARARIAKKRSLKFI
jgi:hypothetical protein